MKKRILFLILLILILPTIFAVDVQMKQEYAQGETIIAKISGNFVEPILFNDVLFYRDHTRVSFLYDITKIGNDYYLYAQTGEKAPNNYSIKIQNVKYQQINTIVEEEIIQNFTITEETADFSVTPGFIKTNESFDLTIQNLQNSDITVTNGAAEEVSSFWDFLGTEESDGEEYELYSGEIKTLHFSVEEINESHWSNIELFSSNTLYEIPIYLLAGNADKELNFRFNPADLDNITLSTGSVIRATTYLQNTGQDKIENITLQVSDILKPYVRISPEKIDELSYNDSQKITLTITSDNNSFDYEGQLTANSDDLYAYSVLHLYFLEGFIPEDGIYEINESEEEQVLITPDKTCSEQNGVICAKEETCSGTEGYAVDGLCCVGNCEAKNQSSSGKIIGWSLVIIIVAFLAWFFLAKWKK